MKLFFDVLFLFYGVITAVCIFRGVSVGENTLAVMMLIMYYGLRHEALNKK